MTAAGGERERSLFSKPALAAAAALAFGILTAHWTRCGAELALGGFAATVVASAAAWRIKNTLALPFVVAAIFVAGIALGAIATPQTAETAATLGAYEDNAGHLFYATCAGEPSVYADGFSFRAVLHAVRSGGKSVPLNDPCAIVRVTFDPGDTAAPPPNEGDRLLLFGKLHAVSGARNPGEFDYGEYLRLQGITVRLAVFSPINDERIGADSSFSLVRAIAGARRSIAAAFDKYVGGDEGNFLKGVLLGEKSELPDDVKDAFINTATYHVLAVSGLHVGFVLLILMGVLSPVTNKYANWLLLVAMLACYTLLGGAASSIQRASLMAGLAATGRLIERRLDGLNVVGAAACILLIADPMQLFGAGFQLSFAAALGLVLFYPRLRGLILGGKIFRVTAVRWAAELFCASLAAQIGTFPLTALYFEKLSIAGFVANMFVVPSAGVALGMAAMVAVLSPVAWLGSMLGDFARLFVHCLLALVQWFGSLPYAYLDIPPFTLAQAVVFYCFAAFLLFVRGWKQFARRAAVAAACIAAIGFSPLSFHRTLFHPHALTVAVMDVGQGDGIVVRLPDGKTMVVDAGPDNARQERNLPVAAFLRRQGITHIAALVLTHLHKDHIGGAPELLRECVVDTIYHGGERAPGRLTRLLDSLAAARRIPAKRLHRGDSLYLDPQVRIAVLYPDSNAVSPAGAPEGGNLNNGSVVLRLQYGESSVLLSGDLEKGGEDSLVRWYGGGLRAGILKTGHHGSATSTSQNYLALVHPRVAIVSVGENNFGHPSPAVIARLRADSIAVERTDKEGAVFWYSRGDMWRRGAWR